MKLVIAVTSKEDAHTVSKALLTAGYMSTTTNSYGGFLEKENSMIFAGVDEKRVNDVIKIIGSSTKPSEENVPDDLKGGNFKLPSHIRIGGAVVFVLDVERFVRL